MGGGIGRWHLLAGLPRGAHARGRTAGDLLSSGSLGDPGLARPTAELRLPRLRKPEPGHGIPEPSLVGTGARAAADWHPPGMGVGVRGGLGHSLRLGQGLGGRSVFSDAPVLVF